VGSTCRWGVSLPPAAPFSSDSEVHEADMRPPRRGTRTSAGRGPTFFLDATQPLTQRGVSLDVVPLTRGAPSGRGLLSLDPRTCGSAGTRSRGEALAGATRPRSAGGRRAVPLRVRRIKLGISCSVHAFLPHRSPPPPPPSPSPPQHTRGRRPGARAHESRRQPCPPRSWTAT
jgi:hypothetical protein